MDHAQNHVKVEFSTAIEHAQILHQLMVENVALDKQLKQEHAIYKAVPVWECYSYFLMNQ